MGEQSKKPTDAEEIFSEFQKTKEKQDEPVSETSTELVESSESTPESTPEPEQTIQETVVESPPEKPQNEEASAEAPSKTEETATRERNVIFVGTKPIMTYVTATLTQLSTQPIVTIKARGRRITQAVDVSQMIVKRMNSVGYKLNDVRIASDSLTSQDGKQRNVSTIEIDISKI